MLTQRIYYSLLKSGALLNFKNVNALDDPIFLVVVYSLFHGTLHLTLKLLQETPLATWDNLAKGSLEEAKFQVDVQNLLKGFVFPGAIFVLFFQFAYMTEWTLLSLSRYFDEDPEAARERAHNFVFLHEGALKSMFASSDLVAEATEKTTAGVVEHIIAKYPQAEKHWAAKEKKRKTFGLSFRLLYLMWPGKVLLDFRLKDKGAMGFRGAFSMLAVFTTSFFVYTVYCFSKRAYQDLYIDVYQKGYFEDAFCALACVMHIGVIIYAGVITMRNLGYCPEVPAGVAKRLSRTSFSPTG